MRTGLHTRATRREQGAAVIWAIIVMLVASALIVAFSMIAQRSADRSADASRRVSNFATTQTAVTRVIFGLQSQLGSEADYYVLDRADLQEIVSGATDVTVVDPSSLTGLSADHTTTFGVMERRESGGGVRLFQVATLPRNAVVQEPVLLDRASCLATGLPAATCTAGTARAYWQVVRVIVPDTTGKFTPSVTVTIRTWLGDPRARSYTKSSYASAEMRPGRFADFQLISDGNVYFGAGAVIDGPVHSNGLEDGSFSSVKTPSVPTGGGGWAFGEPGVTCRGPASISVATGRILGSLTAAACNSQGDTGQTISFMRAIDSMDMIETMARSGRPNAYLITAAPSQRGPEATTTPYDTAWRVRLSGRTMTYATPDGTVNRTATLGRVNAFLFDEDVRVSGSVAADVRVTIAARRSSGGAATLFIDGNVTKGDQTSSSIGLLSEGNIVLWQTPASPCGVTNVQAAMVAATGGITIPPQYTSDEIQPTAPSCTRTLTLNGSFAGHRPPTMEWRWDHGETGYVGRRQYTWDQKLKRNPPPFFPLTGSWQPFNVRGANVDCLFSPSERDDPTCS